MAMILETGGNSATGKGIAPCKTYNGTTVYVANKMAFPASVSSSVITSAGSSTGIQIGSGTTPATEDDYHLESQLTSGCSASAPTMEFGEDENGNPIVEYTFTVTNNSENPITISEIGYFQNLYASTTKGSTSATNKNCMLDRTVLSSPVTIPAGEYAAIKYTLKTVLPSS